MVHGHPDWGQSKAATTIYPVTDLGEVVARQQRIQTWDRAGETIFIDDFEKTTLQWNPGILTGVGAAAAISTARNLAGDKSMQLTTGNAMFDNTQVEKHFEYPQNVRLGFEYAFHLTDSNVYLYWITYIDDTLLRYVPRVDVLVPTRVIRIADPTGWITIDTRPYLDAPGPVSGTWYHLKLVIDVDTKKYVRLIFENTRYDLSAYSLPTMATLGAYHIDTRMEVVNRLAAASRDVYIDNYVMTQNEP